MAPDFQAASKAKNNIFYLLDRKSAIDPEASDEDTPEVAEVSESEYAVEFDDVSFAYPTRPDGKKTFYRFLLSNPCRLFFA